MESQTLQYQSGLTSLPFSNSLSCGGSCQSNLKISNSALQALISLQKAPFLIVEEEFQERKMATPQTTSEKIHHKILHYNRKQKSLEQLSQRFLNQFQGQDKKIIELDKVTQELNVQKRRIYDIINILESLKVVSKNGKNNYKWKGLQEAIETIKLCKTDRDSLKVESIWKQKSLEYLSSGLLKLFIHWKPILSLEEAAREIMKDLEEDGLRTKIRRLYDIINVFKSLKLVKKTTLPNKKSGFQWLGTGLLKDFIANKGKKQNNYKDLMNFSLQIEKSDVQQQKEIKPSFFAQILEENLRKRDIEKVSDLLTSKIWPLTPLSKPQSQPIEQTISLFNNRPHQIIQNRVIISPLQKEISPLF